MFDYTSSESSNVTFSEHDYSRKEHVFYKDDNCFIDISPPVC